MVNNLISINLLFVLTEYNFLVSPSIMIDNIVTDSLNNDRNASNNDGFMYFNVRVWFNLTNYIKCDPNKHRYIDLNDELWYNSICHKNGQKKIRLQTQR